MDFFERQDRARRATGRLIVLFVLAVIGIVAAVYGVVDVVYVEKFARKTAFDDRPVTWWNPQILEIVTLAVLGIIGFGSFFRFCELRRGGWVVASMLGGRPVDLNTQDPDERRVLNIVEEMAIASGTPVPVVYLLSDDNAINAFAAGYSQSDVVIGVTRGAMLLLSRDELQGVIAHEFSHILNGDMRLNMKLMGVVFGIVCIAQIGAMAMRARGRNSSGIALFGLAIFLIGSIGIFFGRLIRSAISRQREFLADASAVQFTRNPDGITGALKKIGGSPHQSFLTAPNTEEAGHFLFGSGVMSTWFTNDWFATHPPLAVRIRAIDPRFDGTYVHTQSLPESPDIFLSPGLDHSQLVGAAATLNQAMALDSRQRASAPQRAASEPLLTNIGAPTDAHLKYAAAFRTALPPVLLEATRTVASACGLAYALIIASDQASDDAQLALLAPQAHAAVYAETVRLIPEIERLPSASKLPLIDMSIPALRQLSPTQYAQFRAGIDLLVHSDSKLDLFEYALQKSLIRNLDTAFNPTARRPIQHQSINPLIPDCVLLLSALSYVAHGNSALARSAFQQGAKQLNVAGSDALQPVAGAECRFDALDAALDRLGLAVPYVKKNALFACATTVMSDGIVQVEEWELMRAIANTLDCPVPPFVETGAERLARSA
jgi:Zn-dependent protease with chaperone function